MELLIVVAVIAILAAIAIPALMGAKERALYAQFQANAHQIGVALENFAIDHEGRYPRDGMYFSPPPGGFTPGYINWNQDWRIDYEVHGNGSGGSYVGLEYFYPGQRTIRPSATMPPIGPPTPTESQFRGAETASGSFTKAHRSCLEAAREGSLVPGPIAQRGQPQGFNLLGFFI